jgi:tetraacyldisaccharide-1-P 4'-kinase
MVFRDHHWFTDGDVQTIRRAAAAAGVDCVVTTEKDAMRLSFPGLFYLPMRLAIEPGDEFGEWLARRLAVARAGPGVAA